MPSNTQEYYKEWYAKNGEKHRQNQNKRIECVCGSIVCKSNLSKHYNSIKHKSFKMPDTIVRSNEDFEKFFCKYQRWAKEVAIYFNNVLFKTICLENIDRDLNSNFELMDVEEFLSPFKEFYDNAVVVVDGVKMFEFKFN